MLEEFDESHERVCRIQRLLDGKYYPMVQVETIPGELHFMWMFNSIDKSPLRFKTRWQAQEIIDIWLAHGWTQVPTYYCLFLDLRHTLEITGQWGKVKGTDIPGLNMVMR